MNLNLFIGSFSIFIHLWNSFMRCRCKSSILYSKFQKKTESETREHYNSQLKDTCVCCLCCCCDKLTPSYGLLAVYMFSVVCACVGSFFTHSVGTSPLSLPPPPTTLADNICREYALWCGESARLYRLRWMRHFVLTSAFREMALRALVITRTHGQALRDAYQKEHWSSEVEDDETTERNNFSLLCFDANARVQAGNSGWRIELFQ